MSDSDSDRCCLSDACYCFHGNNTNTQNGRNWEAKEISNPLPLDYFLMSDEELKESNKKLKGTQTDGMASFSRNDVSTQLSRRQNNVSAPSHLRQGNSSDRELQLLKGIRSDTIYQEIIEANNQDPSKTNKARKKQLQQQAIKQQNQGYLSPQVSNQKQDKPITFPFDKSLGKINIKFITNRIIVGYLSESTGANYNLMMKSLSTTYGKQIKRFDLKVVNSSDKFPKSSEFNETSLYSLVHLMPAFTDLLSLVNVFYKWLRNSRKHVVILLCETSRCEILLGILLKFLLTADETNRRYLKKDSVVLLEHEINSLKYFEKIYLEKFCNPSLNRYVLHCSNLTLKTTQFNSDTKQLHAIIINYDVTRMSLHHRSGARLRNSHAKSSCLDCGSNYGDDDLSENCRLQNIYLTIYRNFSLIHTTYKINIAPNIQPDKLIYLIDPVLLLNGDILVFFNATNKMGFQTIFFRLQFHTCWLKGDYTSFKSNDLDKSYSNCHVDSIGTLELHFRHLPGLAVEHENAILSHNYSVAHLSRSTTSSDIVTQLQLLEHCLKAGHTLSYTAGPLDGNLYAAISKPTPKNSPSKEDAFGKTEKSTQTQQVNQIKTSPSIIHKFNNLEHEISTAADLINTSIHKATVGRRPEPQIPKKTQSKPILPKLTMSNTQQKEYHEEKTKLDHTEHDEKHLPRSTSYNTHKATANYVSLCNARDGRSPSNIPETHNDTMYHQKVTSSPYDNIDGGNRLFHRAGSADKAARDDYVMSPNEMPQMAVRNTKRKKQHQHRMEYDNFHATDEDNRETRLMHFIMQNENMWYKPNFTRQDAILFLMNLPIGAFVIRTSTSFANSLTLAIKCSTSLVFSSSMAEPLDHVKHFILDYIAPSSSQPSGGYEIRGLSSAGVHPTLPDLIMHHLDHQNAYNSGLPVPLILLNSVHNVTTATPAKSSSFCVRTLSPNSRMNHRLFGNSFDDERQILSDDDYAGGSHAISSNTIINNITVYHLGSYITRHRATQEAAKRSIILSVDRLQQKLQQQYPTSTNQSNSVFNWITKMSLRLTNDRIILTDLNRKMFFRKHIKLTDILCCCVDPQRRVWNLPITKGSVFQSASGSPSVSPIFGIVSHIASNSSHSTNTNQMTEYSDQIYCQLFCTIDRNTDNYCSLIHRAIKFANTAHLT